MQVSRILYSTTYYFFIFNRLLNFLSQWSFSEASNPHYRISTHHFLKKSSVRFGRCRKPTCKKPVQSSRNIITSIIKMSFVIIEHFTINGRIIISRPCISTISFNVFAILIKPPMNHISHCSCPTHVRVNTSLVRIQLITIIPSIFRVPLQPQYFFCQESISPRIYRRVTNSMNPNSPIGPIFLFFLWKFNVKTKLFPCFESLKRSTVLQICRSFAD